MSYILSPSSLNLLKDCPRCFWLQCNKGIKRPAGIYPSLPFGVDMYLKKRSDYFREKKMLPPELYHLKFVSLFDSPMLALWRNTKLGIRWRDPNGHELRGALDDVLQDGDKLIVLEYVTRGFPVKEESPGYYQDQLNLYTFLLQQNGFPTEDYACLLFYHPKGMNFQGDLWFEKQLVKRKVSVADAKKVFEYGIRMLQGAISEKKCGFCSGVISVG